jgi:hypothetical protein
VLFRSSEPEPESESDTGRGNRDGPNGPPASVTVTVTVTVTPAARRRVTIGTRAVTGTVTGIMSHGHSGWRNGHGHH